MKATSSIAAFGRLAIIAATMLLAACVNSEPRRNSLGGPAAASGVEHDPSKQTTASKVLGAIAFERVTKRKADPARLIELH
jgi:hypothetical protein